MFIEVTEINRNEKTLIKNESSIIDKTLINTDHIIYIDKEMRDGAIEKGGNSVVHMIGNYSFMCKETIQEINCLIYWKEYEILKEKKRIENE